MKVAEWKVDQLIPYWRNPRKNDHALDLMVSGIKEFGFRIPIVAKSDGEVVDGHLRLKAARKLGLKKVPVVLADDLTPAQIKAFRLLANKSQEWAEWDWDLLRLEIEELQECDYAVELTGFDLQEIFSNFTPTNGNEQSQLDEKKKVICPSCGEEFVPK